MDFQTDFQICWNSGFHSAPRAFTTLDSLEKEREKDSFEKSLKVWNSEVSGILGSSVKYDKCKHGINFKTLAIRNF